MKKLCKLLYVVGIACIVICVVLSGCKKQEDSGKTDPSPSPDASVTGLPMRTICLKRKKYQPRMPNGQWQGLQSSRPWLRA